MKANGNSMNDRPILRMKHQLAVSSGMPSGSRVVEVASNVVEHVQQDHAVDCTNRCADDLVAESEECLTD